MPTTKNLPGSACCATWWGSTWCATAS